MLSQTGGAKVPVEMRDGWGRAAVSRFPRVLLRLCGGETTSGRRDELGATMGKSASGARRANKQKQLRDSAPVIPAAKYRHVVFGAERRHGQGLSASKTMVRGRGRKIAEPKAWNTTYQSRLFARVLRASY